MGCEICGEATEFGNTLCDRCAYEMNGRAAIECELCGGVKDHAVERTCRKCAQEIGMYDDAY